MQSNSFSIGNNNSSLLSNSIGDADVNSVKSSNSIWETIFGTALPALFQSGGALLANNANARAQVEISRNQGGFLNMANWGAWGQQGIQRTGGNMWMWIIVIAIIAVVLFFILRKK